MSGYTPDLQASLSYHTGRRLSLTVRREIEVVTREKKCLPADDVSGKPLHRRMDEGKAKVAAS